jgi:hypothetical protein
MWRTPTPYLFLGFGFMMGLIAVALLVLICTRRKPSWRRRGAGIGDEAASSSPSARALAPLDREPKVVVVMAGHDLPSFLASVKPLGLAPATRGGAETLAPEAAAAAV